ncbi:hypothetical protein GW17_00010516 [Ensete ventricosum]|nr:hypothetical protein GW17_00010516 [Ensete ventricosum]
MVFFQVFNKRFCYQKSKCSAAITENATATQSLSNKVERYKASSASSCKFSPISSHLKSEEKQEDIQDEVSVLDLLNDDNKNIDCRGRVVPESYVAFSVGGTRVLFTLRNLTGKLV